MRAIVNRLLWLVVLTTAVVSTSSCTDGTGAPAVAGLPAPAERPAPKPVVPPVVSIGDALPVLDIVPAANSASPAAKAFTAIDEDEIDSDEPEEKLVEPDPGTPEWLIREITKLRSAPLDAVKSAIPGKPGEFQVVQLTEQQADAEEMRRAEKVVSLALEVCAKTKDDKHRVLLFNNAVHYLANSWVTLAAYGDHDQVRLLDEEAEMLFQRDPKSFGAIELQLKLVECLAELSEQNGRKNDAWGTAAARQARLFASRFPQESNRSALALVSAARACEVAGRFDEARQCFGLLERDFSATPFAEQAAGALRRYKLNGQPLGEFAGATIDGGFISIDQYVGRPVLVIFWSAESPSFREDLPRLKQLVSTKADRSMAVVGVNMDVDESVVDSFLEQSEITWRTIFFSSLDQRGIRNPLARAFGVTSVPQYWLIDAKGTVVAAPVDLKTLETRFSQIASQPGTSTKR